MNPVKLIPPVRHGDDRGWFTEVYNERSFAALGILERFAQDNHSWSRHAGVLRGLHFQTPPAAQAKLVRCIRGAIFDVAADVRKGSPTYGKWVAATLSAANGHQLFMPAGFAHGFLTLEPDTEVTYKVSGLYDRQHDTGLAFDDPDIAVPWPLAAGAEPTLSAKDIVLRARRLADFDSPFAYDGHPLLPLEGGTSNV
jgi:dTDP-4-dehydrorhamnose 3,5-epimerase